VTIRGRSAAVLFTVAGLTWALDRLTKIWVERSLAGRPPISVIDGVLDLRFTTNSGGAFSVGRSAPWIFVTASILVSGAIVLTAFRHTNVGTSIALGLILGGALGNLTDRLLRGPRFTGHVIDFIDVHIWPIFNVADSAIVVGAVVLALSSLGPERDPASSSDDG
jgi:signal peptidase II